MTRSPNGRSINTWVRFESEMTVHRKQGGLFS